jgi:hypothetical protein
MAATQGLAGGVAVKSVRLVLPVPASPVMENIGRVLERQLGERCDAKVVRRAIS